MSEPRTERLGPMRAEVLHHLREGGRPVAVADVASAVGLHPNTTRFHLDALAESGLVLRTVEQRNQPGRPKVLYQAVPGHRADHYQNLAAALVKHFATGLTDRSERARAAGRAWGNELRAEREQSGPEAPVERLVHAMADLGYQPAFIDGPAPTVVLRPCPFLDLAADDPEVICQLHLGLARGLLGPDQPWEVTGIDPMVTSTTCLIHLARIAAYAGTNEAGEDA